MDKRYRTPIESTLQKISPVDDKPKPKPKVANVSIIKSVTTEGMVFISGTELTVSDLPSGLSTFNLMVSLSPVGNAPAQAPPFHEYYNLNPGTNILSGAELSFQGGMEPPSGSGHYTLSLVKNITTGKDWDVSEATVTVIDGLGMEEQLSNNDIDPVMDKPKPKPKVANVSIIKSVNLPGDLVTNTYQVQMEVDDLPAGVSAFSLSINLTANNGEPAPSSNPSTNNFSLDDGNLVGSITFNGEVEVNTNAYTLNAVLDNGTNKNWQIINSTVPVIE